MLRSAQAILEDRPFVPGTTGWTASALEDPEIERLWFAGHYEIVEGVLTNMPPAYYAGGRSLYNLMKLLDEHFESTGARCEFSTEVDIVVDEHRVARADAVMLLPDDVRRQRRAARAAGKKDFKRTRILVPPTLIIESVSPGHEAHDRRTKRMWYAEFGVPNYWILDAFTNTLECLALESGAYRLDVRGKGNRVLKPSAFAPLSLRLASIWGGGF